MHGPQGHQWPHTGFKVTKLARCAASRKPRNLRCMSNLNGVAPGSAPLPGGLMSRWITRAARLLGGGSIAAGMLVASLPSILSSRLGLDASLFLVNAFAPSPVEIAEVEAGWFTPLRMSGIRLKERSSKGNQILAEVDEVTYGGGFWHLAHAIGFMPLVQSGGKGSSEVGDSVNPVLMVLGAKLNCEYNPVSGDWRLLEWLQGMGRPARPNEDVKESPSPTAKILDQSCKQTLSHDVEALAQQRSAKPQYRKASAFFEGENNNDIASVTGGQALVTGNDSFVDHKPSSSSVYKASSSSADAVASASPTGSPGRLMQMLSRSDAVMGMTVDFRTGRGGGLQVLIPDAKLWVPHEIRDLLGGHMHVTGAMGSASLQEWAKELRQEDIGWASSIPGSTRFGSANRFSLPREGYEPGILQADSDHLQANMKFWRGPDQTFVLHEPASCALEFTPALSQFGLATVNPLLSSAVVVQSGPSLSSFPPGNLSAAGGRSQCQVPLGPSSLHGGQVSLMTDPRAVRMQLYPDGMSLPYRGGVVVVQPLTLKLAAGGLMEEICSGLRITNASDLRQGSIEVRTSKMQVRHVPRGGPITTNRVDMTVGKTLSLSMWGTHQPSTGSIDMVVGLNAGLLSRLRIRSDLLPEGYVLPVAMRGTVDHPIVDYSGAARRLAALLLRQQYYASSLDNGAQDFEVSSADVRGIEASSSGGAVAAARRIGGFLSKAVQVLVRPTLEGAMDIEAAMKKDIESVPKPWDLS